MTAGADGYLTKPFSLEHVVARLQSLIGGPDVVLTVGDLEMNVERRTARRGGTEIPLTASEFDVLHLLVRNAGRVVPEEEIHAHVWGGTFRGRTNLVALTINYLRRKVNGGREPLLHVVAEAGYLLTGPAD